MRQKYPEIVHGRSQHEHSESIINLYNILSNLPIAIQNLFEYLEYWEELEDACYSFGLKQNEIFASIQVIISSHSPFCYKHSSTKGITPCFFLFKLQTVYFICMYNEIFQCRNYCSKFVKPLLLCLTTRQQRP